MKRKGAYKRIQFDFSNEYVAMLDGLVEETGSATKAEVVRKALTFFDILVDKKKEGFKTIELKNESRIESIPIKALV